MTITKSRLCLIVACILFAWATIAALGVITVYPFVMPLGFTLWVLANLVT